MQLFSSVFLIKINIYKIIIFLEYNIKKIIELIYLKNCRNVTFTSETKSHELYYQPSSTNTITNSPCHYSSGGFSFLFLVLFPVSSFHSPLPLVVFFSPCGQPSTFPCLQWRHTRFSLSVINHWSSLYQIILICLGVPRCVFSVCRQCVRC